MAITSGVGFYPSTTQMANNLINIVRRNFTETVVYQNLRKAQPFLRFLLEHCVRPRNGGFSPITQPVAFSTFGFTPQYTDFNASFQMQNLQNPIVNAEFNQAAAIAPITYLISEMAIVDSPLTVIDPIRVRLYDTYRNCLDFLSSAFMGTAGSNAQAILGLLDAIDAGGNQATYGGLTRSSYTAWNSNIWANTQTGAAYLQLAYYIMSFMNKVNSPLPSFGLISYPVFYSLVTSFTSFERMITAQTTGGVMTDREYQIQAVDVFGVPHVVDPNLGTSTTAYYPNMEHIYIDVNTDLNFKMTDLESMVPLGQVAFVQVLLLAMQMYTDLPSAHYAITSAPSTTLAT